MPIIFSNRALSYLKLKHWALAEDDATSALRICPNDAKCYHSRALSRISLGKLRAALLDVYAAEDSCDNNILKKEIEILKSKCENALADAVKHAPRRRVQVAIV
ncbi:hypothetical protein ACHAXM_009356 [Skeletonema potamos]|jgi:hypothetical protein